MWLGGYSKRYQTDTCDYYLSSCGHKDHRHDDDGRAFFLTTWNLPGKLIEARFQDSEAHSYFVSACARKRAIITLITRSITYTT
jgi:hypothetical protein